MRITLCATIVVLSVVGCATPPPPQSEEEAAPVETAAANPEQPSGERIGGVAPRQIIAMFGARLRDGVTDRQLANYRRVFGFGDRDRDGRHSKKEYVDDGRYMTRRARQGIFRAADFDNDGFVTRAEYVNNRIITDEAKEIFDDMDSDGDRRLTVEELVGSGKLSDEQLARAVFKALDTDRNGALIIPEYLRVWGRWARSQAPQSPR